MIQECKSMSTLIKFVGGLMRKRVGVTQTGDTELPLQSLSKIPPSSNPLRCCMNVYGASTHILLLHLFHERRQILSPHFLVQRLQLQLALSHQLQ